MKKSLIALAVAGAFATPAAFAASSNIDFYGKFRVSVDHFDNGIGWQMNDQTSRVGFKGAEDLGGGLKAIYQWESGFNIGTAAAAIPSTGNAGGTYTGGTTSLGAQRNTFLGLAGDFGTALAGRHDTPYKMVGSADLFGDTAADAENGAGLVGNFGPAGLCIICEDVRASNAIAYVSPSFSGLTIAAATVVGNGTQGSATVPTSTNSLSDAQSIAAMYNNGPLTLGLAYENLGKVGQNAVESAVYKATGLVYNNASKPDAWKFNIGYTIDSFKLGGTYERLNKIGGVSDAKANNYLLSAAYGMGPITLAAQYGYRNFNSTVNGAGIQDLTDATIGVVYSLSKRTSTYLGYAHYKLKNGSTTTGGVTTAVADAKYNVVTIGLNHDF